MTTYYQDNFQGHAGQTARAEEVTAEFDGVENGFLEVAVDVGRSLRGAPAEVVAELPAALTRANKWLRFDANGNPIAVTAPFNYRGLYQIGQLYYVGDVIQQALHQSLLYCTTQHTSGDPIDLSKWTTFIDLNGVPFFNYRVINSAGTTNLNIADSVAVDSTAGNIVLNLPSAGIALGTSPINITHVGGSLASGQSVTIVATGLLTIMGTVETTLLLDTVNASFSLSYCGPAYGWRLRVMG